MGRGSLASVMGKGVQWGAVSWVWKQFSGFLKTCKWMFIAALFVIANKWKLLQFHHWWMDKQNNIFMKQDIKSNQGEWSADTYYSMDKPQTHYTEVMRTKKTTCGMIPFIRHSRKQCNSKGQKVGEWSRRAGAGVLRPDCKQAQLSLGWRKGYKIQLWWWLHN